MNDIMKNLYVVSSPFQCISAIEAKTQMVTMHNILVVVYYLKDGIDVVKQIRETLNITQWEDVIEIGVDKKKSKYFEYISIIKKLKKSIYDNIFIGHFGQFQTTLLSNLKINRIYAIDDGILTIKLHKTELNPNLKNSRSLAKNIKMLRYSLLGLKTTFDKTRVNYFTMFDLEAYYGELIVKNNFIFMKKYSLNKRRDDRVAYLLGQPLYDSGFLEKERYLYFLKSIKNFLKERGMTVLYIPHRREKNIEYLKYLEDEDFKIKNLYMPIELYLLKSDILPMEIYSFISTALFSIQKIFFIKTAAVYIEKEFLLCNHENIEKTYDELKDYGVHILKV